MNNIKAEVIIQSSNHNCSNVQDKDQVEVITIDSTSQVVRRDPSARAAVAQLQDAVKKQEVGLGLAVLPRRMLSDISQDVDKLTRGFSSRWQLPFKQFCKVP